MNCSQQVNANASGGKIENVFVPREPPMCGCAARTGGALRASCTENSTLSVRLRPKKAAGGII